ncbi:MAG TPA: YXWGXW repeat-containing protein [Candidatus Binatia bacterium]|nr:YXWGXW repeat-containing protein [Candidatus Binatia bacterium]
MVKPLTFITMVVATMPLLGTGCVVKREHEIHTTTTRSPVVSHDIVVQRPPMPDPRVEIRTTPPSSEFRWVEGHWEWNGADWEWSAGYWTP